MIIIQSKKPKQLQEIIDKVQSLVGLNGIESVLEKFGETMVKSIQRNFDEEGRPIHWQPLKPATVKTWLRKKGIDLKGGEHIEQLGKIKIGLSDEGLAAFSGRKILQDTGFLRASINAKMIDRLTLAVRADCKYAYVHQFGSPKKNIPARPFMMVQPEDWEFFKSQVKVFLTK